MSLPHYPEYKDSGVEWLGEVPEHWDVVQFKQFVDIQNGSDHKHVEQSEGYPVLGSGGVFTYASDYLYDGESVLLGRKGTINKPLHIDGRFWTVDTMYWTKINPAASGRFTYYSALTIPFDYYSTNTALPSMTKGALSSHWIARPPFPEQTQIAAFLDRETGKIDALIAEQRQLVDLLAEKRQAVISHAVTKGLNPNAKMKDSGIEWLGEVPEHWELRATKRLFRLVAEPAPDDNDHELLSIYTAIGVRPRKELEAKGNKATTTDGYWLVQKGDLIVNKLLAWMGAIGISEYDGVTSPAYDILRQRVLLDPRFYDYLFRCGICFSEFRRWSRGIMDMRLRLYFDELGQLVMPYPPELEQREIVSFLQVELERFDTLTLEANRAIELLQERRSALISAAVTGQIDVREQ